MLLIFGFFISVSLPCWCWELSYFYSSSSCLFFVAFIFSIESYLSVHDVSSLSVREVSVYPGWTPSASFCNELNPGEKLGMFGGRLLSFSIPKVFLSWFGIGSFIGGDVESDLFLFSFL